MKFLIQEDQRNSSCSLVYRKDDFSFDIYPPQENGFTSILINDLQLEIDDKGNVLYVWGLCPIISYQETTKVPQNYKINGLMAMLDKKPIPGVSFRLNEKNRWPVYVNKKDKWICIGDTKNQNVTMIEFAPGCVATMSKQEIIAIWLHPEIFP